MEKNEGADDCETKETGMPLQIAEEKPTFTQKPEDAKSVSKDEDMEVVEPVSEMERSETVSEDRESPSKGKNICSTIELDLERRDTVSGEPVSKSTDVLTVEPSLESKTTETLKGDMKSSVIDETYSVSKSTESITKDIQSVPKKTESMSKDTESTSKNTEFISEIPESNDSKSTMKDTESAPKNTESVVKNPESFPKNIESDSEDPKSVSKDTKSISENLKCASVNAESVSEVPESTSKIIVSVSKNSESDPKNIESVSKDPEPISKDQECVAEKPECVPKNTGSILEEPKPISDIIESVSEEPEPAPKNTESVSEEPKSVPKNTESVSEEPKPAPKNTESVSEKPKSVPKNTESVSEEPKPAPKNTESVSEKPKSVPKNTESISEEPKPAPKNTESVSEKPKSVPKNTESVSKEPEPCPKNTEFVSKDPSVLEESKSAGKSTESVTNNPECVQKNTETVSEKSKSEIKSTESVSNNPECVQKHTESVSETSESVPENLESVSKDAESELEYTKNSESVLKNKDSVPKSTESVSKDNESELKDTKSVQKNIEPPVEESKSTSEDSVSPENTESVAKTIECVSEDVKSLSRDTESVAKDTEIVSKDIVSVSEGTVSVSGNSGSVTENAESISENKEFAKESTGSISKNRDSPTDNAGLISRDGKCVTESTELVSKEAISVVQKEESVSKSKESVSEFTKPVLITEDKEIVELVTEATDIKCSDSVPKGEEGKVAEPVSPPKETEYIKLSSTVESEKHKESKTKESTLSQVELGQKKDVYIEETSSQKPEEETNTSDEVEDPSIVDSSNEIELQDTQIDVFMQDSDSQKLDSEEKESQKHLESQNTADEAVAEQLREEEDSGEIEMDVEEISQTAREQLPITKVKEENKDDSQEIVCVKDDSQEVVCVKDDSQEIICVNVEDDSEESHETPNDVVDEARDGEKTNDDDDVTTQQKEGQIDESDYEGSSQETYCSESSLQRTDQSDIQTTGTYGCSQATTVDVADLETMSNSEADMFASQNTQEDTPASGASVESSETVVNYSDFVKGSNNGSTILKTSTTLSMIESETSSNKTDECTRKRKYTEEDDSEEKSAKVQRIAEEKTVVEGASISDDNIGTSKDKVAKDKSVVSLVNPTKVDLKEKEVEISPKADRQKLSLVSSPAASRKLDFETESNAGDKKRTQFVLVPSSSKEVEMTEEVKTDKDEETNTQKMAETPESQVSADSSPEVEIVETKKSRKSIEVVYASISSHSNSSWQPTFSSQKRLPGDLEEIVEVEDKEDEKKDTEESSEEELFLHLSPSPSQKSSSDIHRTQKSSGSLSASTSANHTSYSSYKSSNAASYTQSEQDSDSTKKAREFVVGTSNSKKHSIYTIHEDEVEKGSQTQNSGSSSSSEHTNGLVGGDKMEFSLTRKDILSPEDTPAITDSFTTFSKVKDVAQMTAKEEQSQFSVAMDVESEHRTSKRKRCAEKDSQVINVLGSDSESDGHSTPGDVQKKARIEAADLANGRKDTSSSLSLADTLLHKDATQGNEASEVIECERKVTMDVHVKLRYSKQNNKILFLGVQHCEDVTDEIIQFASRRLSDYSSSGYLGDVSKNPSPSSVTSGSGPYPLPPNRLSLISMTSSSSSSSGGSSVAQGVLRNKQVIDGGHFVMPNQPGPRSSRDRSFRSEDATTGARPGLHTSLVEGMDLIERVLLSIHPEREHLGSIKTTRSDIGRKEMFQKTTEEQKYISDSPQETLDQKTADNVGVSSAVSSDVLPTPANVLKETPKSSTKPSKGSKTRSTVKKRSLSFSKSKGKENVEQEKETSELTPIPEGRKGRRTPVRNKSSSASVTPVGTDVQIQKTKAEETPDSPKRICRTPEVPSESTTKSLKPGALVFARWTDRKYYSGKIKEIGKDERWLVLFDDGNVKSLVEDFIIAVDVLSKGQLVYALAEDEDYLSGVIINVEKKRSNYMYSVELDEGNVVSVTRSSLFMTEDQAKILRETVVAASPKTTPHRKADVTLENVLEGKRSRLSGKETPKALDTPGISGESKSTPKRKVSSPVSSESDAGSALDYVDGVEAESTGFEFKSGRVKGQSKSTPRKNDITLLLGPMPPQGSKIFAGKFFLLTISDATGHELEATDNSSTENTDTAESDKNPLALLRTDIPFSKSYLAEQISAGGGTVCNRFQEIAPNKYDVCYLITNKPNLTSKFIFCLAHGIPILSHSWIVDSCKKNSCLDTLEYVVPGGWSLEKKQYINKQKQRPLSRMKVGLVSEQKYFVKFWEIVLKGAGASVFLIPAEKGTKDLKDLQVVVAHHPCPYDIMKQLKELDKPVVSTTWIVQCLINGTKCSFRGHPRYYSLSD
ncbi:TP53-binding protein 1-like isoform X2 [Periplaneta americana]|uniref:TP53-binding protein 1-like isoform X2 n=1 Tax=Periplaneta americana TaxID=6978 RepID=UPI0037E7F7FB